MQASNQKLIENGAILTPPASATATTWQEIDSLRFPPECRISLTTDFRTFYPKLAVKSFHATVHQNSKYISGLETAENTADLWYQQAPPECSGVPPRYPVSEGKEYHRTLLRPETKEKCDAS
jgi:hypothetical protein